MLVSLGETGCVLVSLGEPECVLVSLGEPKCVLVSLGEPECVSKCSRNSAGQQQGLWKTFRKPKRKRKKSGTNKVNSEGYKETMREKTTEKRHVSQLKIKN